MSRVETTRQLIAFNSSGDSLQRIFNVTLNYSTIKEILFCQDERSAIAKVNPNLVNFYGISGSFGILINTYVIFIIIQTNQTVNKSYNFRRPITVNIISELILDNISRAF